MNKFTGVLVADAKVNTTKSGCQVVDFKVVENRTYKTKDGEKKEVSTFIDCADWHRIKLAPYLVKGAIVEVTGEVGAKAYLNKDGEPVGVLTTTVREIRLFHSPKGVVTPDVQSQEDITTDDLPF